MQHTFLIPCHMCGQATALHALHCEHCGAASSAAAAINEPSTRSRPKTAIMIGVAAALVLVGVFAEKLVPPPTASSSSSSSAGAQQQVQVRAQLRVPK